MKRILLDIRQFISSTAFSIVRVRAKAMHDASTDVSSGMINVRGLKITQVVRYHFRFLGFISLKLLNKVTFNKDIFNQVTLNQITFIQVTLNLSNFPLRYFQSSNFQSSYF